MSLENQIASLVSAANNLTGQVAGKMGLIDERMKDAEDQFDQFTGQDFPQRVSDAREIKIYLDTLNGNDSNTGLNWSNSVRTWGKIKQIAGNNIYDIVTVLVAAKSNVMLDYAVQAKSWLRLIVSTGQAGDVTAFFQGFYDSGRPIQPFRAPYVEISADSSHATELHTAEFKEGHQWETTNTQAQMIYNGSLFSNAPRIKLRKINLKLHDMPLSMIYMGGSMGAYATYQMVFGATCDVSIEPAGASSADYVNSPQLVYCYNDPKVPLDIIASNLTTNATAMSDLFGNTSTVNVRSNFTI